ncbi:Phosphoglycerate mutase-like protein [Glarea lozoyensis ATCC 20868]|uniref:Phosphoglycerate mutase-like protein n=1 Tax=Glarea lozoyensis (strain ATCC 20868 / MF5171) TaxID=1116229 RepID=S3DAS5_GLAL2|nr:Phosphoglycerate mutase-like protein [Glarea lozoyensis ATCC 20868]EPE29086.1 Phosphoglycerate mutase-like protein [Glarea lozoyensis ATCC 20868]
MNFVSGLPIVEVNKYLYDTIAAKIPTLDTMRNPLALDTSNPAAAYKKEYSGHTSFGHMPIVRLLSHVASINGEETTLPEAVPLLLDLSGQEQDTPDRPNRPIVVQPDELENHFRQFVLPTAVEQPFQIPQYAVDDGNEAEREIFWHEMKVPSALKNLLRFKPIRIPSFPRFTGQRKYPFKLKWRRPMVPNVTYHYPSSQVLKPKKPWGIWKAKQRGSSKQKPTGSSQENLIEIDEDDQTENDNDKPTESAKESQTETDEVKPTESAEETQTEIEESKQGDVEPRRRTVYFHLMRHGEAAHNIINPNIRVPHPDGGTVTAGSMLPNPPLTEKGFSQARQVSYTFPLHKITHIFSSPLVRTLQTALVAFEPILYSATAKAPVIIAWKDLREWGNRPCSTGDNLEKLKEDFRNYPIHFGLLEEGWEENDDKECYCCRRSRYIRVRNDLARLSQILLNGGNFKGLVFPPHTGRNDLHVMLVSHGGFLSTLKYSGELAVEEPEHSENSEKVPEDRKQYFDNAEICSCEVVEVEIRKDNGKLEFPIALAETGGYLRGVEGTFYYRRMAPREP